MLDSSMGTPPASVRRAARRANLPVVSYPAALPISQKKDEILAALRDHQVVVVAGETGSGKTTQLPKICLELGRGVRGMIGHTQPRRLAARTVAERITEELRTPLGGAGGYQVRFTDQVGDVTLVKLMTDGILLAELQRDRMLRRYDTLIVDEAHERNLNVDFILGYLKRLLPRRGDLKVVITSATIDPERFSRHFGGAPVVEVSGRTYPVEVRYRPIVADAGDADRDQTQAVCDAVDELCAEGPGDVLVFLSGEREIRDTADALRRQVRPGTEILPLYARLSAAEQHRVFKTHAGRRVVLATNVAETSLTVPGIKYVVDPGSARISRYSHRTKVQRLPIEPVSQASADQRKGRCGRVSAGICIRLYSEEDFASRPEFTEPEILRTNLASVILQMTAVGLGDMAAFPFVDAPDRRDVKAGVQLLEELGALEASGHAARRRLTPLGRKLAQLPLDPRLARMVVEADRNACVREVMVIAAALSIQDPRERPTDRQEAADQQHRRFADPGSDFLAYLNLWQYLRERQKALSSSQFRKLCRTEFLNYLRIREWQDIYGQLRQTVKPLGITLNREPADPHAVHLSLLAGLLSHVGLKDPEKQEYLGARGARFAVFPGSALFKKPPRWVMAAELVETSRLWGRIAARIEPEWIEPLAGHLVKRSYSEPHWERERGAVVAYERVTLYGVPVVARRKVGYGRVDPELSRELFIREALVGGDWDTHHAFFQANRKLLEDVEELEDRARRRGQPARLPGHLAAGRAAPAPLLRVRAGQRRRRRDREHPAAGAQPGRRRRLRLAGPRVPGGAGDRAAQDAAQAAAPRPRAAARQREAGPGTARAAARAPARRARAGAGPRGRGGATRRLAARAGAGPPRDHLPGAGRGRPHPGPGQGPGGAQGGAGAGAADRAVRPGRLARAARAARLGLRDPAADLRAPAGRLPGDRLPGPGGRGRRRRDPDAGERGRAATRHVAGHAAAAARNRPVAAARPAGAAQQQGPAGLDPEPAREHGGAARRLRRLRRRPPGRRGRRAGLGPGRLRAAPRPGPRRAPRHRGGGLHQGAAHPRGRPPGQAAAGRHRRRGAAAGRRRRHRAAVRAGLPGLRQRRRLAAAARRAALPACRGAPAREAPRQPAPRPGLDAARRGGAAGLRAARGRAAAGRGRGGAGAHPLDDRGAARQPLRRGARNPPPGVRETHLPGDGRADILSR